MKVYVAGPMSGIPDFNFPAFHAAEKQLAEMGYEVVSPTQHGQEGEWADFMRKDIKLLVDCDGIVMLPGWHLSRGATLENKIATELGLRVGTLQRDGINWIQ